MNRIFSTSPRFFRQISSTTILLAVAISLWTGSLAAQKDKIERELKDGSFSAVWMTDTQYYTEPHGEIGAFLKMTDWIKRYRMDRNIQFLVHTGDIVDNNDPSEWSRAEECLETLAGEIPYFLAVGNHDMGNRGKADVRDFRNFNEHFKAGDNPLTANSLGGVFEQGHLENAYYFVDYGKWSLIIFTFEFAPRPEVIGWADQIVSLYPERKVILAMHDFIDHYSSLESSDGMPIRSRHEAVRGWSAKYPVAKKETILSSEEIWQQLINKHDSFIMTINGHFGAHTLDKNGNKISGKSTYASSYRIDKTAMGNYVHQMLFNPQYLWDFPGKGGQGFMRLMEFQPDGETIEFRTFSPVLAMDKDDTTEPFYSGEWDNFSINTRTGKRSKLKAE